MRGRGSGVGAVKGMRQEASRVGVLVSREDERGAVLREKGR